MTLWDPMWERPERLVTYGGLIVCTVCNTSMFDEPEVMQLHEDFWHSTRIPAAYQVVFDDIYKEDQS